MEALLSKTKMALRITCSDFDEELTDLILAGIADLGIAGVSADTDDPLLSRAVITYVKLHFGDLESEDYERLNRSYELQRGQMYMATGYTDWGDEQ